MRYYIFILLFLPLFILGCAKKKHECHETDRIIYGVNLDTTYNLLIYHLSYKHIDLVCGEMPLESDSSVIFCAEAAFTGKQLNEFKHSNIMGPHISNGVLHDGYPYTENYGLFAAADSSWQFSVLPNGTLLDTIVKQGGMAFTQHWVIKDGEIFPSPTQKDPTRRNIYRVIADLNEELVIIESRRSIAYEFFLKCLKQLPINNALYMDMGTGWNYSFYRDINDSLYIIHPHIHDFCTNWITFYK